MAENTKRCENCRYWSPIGADDDGHCYRYPPMPVPDTAGYARGLHPVSGAGEWCGEWAAREMQSAREGRDDG